MKTSFRRMRSPYLMVAVAIACAVVLGSVTQEPGRNVAFGLSSATRAGAVVEAGLAAMGGLEELQRVTGVYRELAGVRTDEGQGAAPVDVTPTRDGIGTIPPETSRPLAVSARDLRGQRSAEYVQAFIRGGAPLERRFVARRDSAFTVLYDYVYRGIRSTPPAGTGAARAGQFRRHPESILQTAWGRRETLRWLGETRYDGRRQEVIAFADADGSLITLYFDAATHLLTKSESVADNAVYGDAVVEVVFGDYRLVGGLQLPHRYVDRVAGFVLQDLRVTALTVNQPMPESLFTKPAGFPEVSFEPRDQVQKLAEDVYVALGVGDYNSLFVVYDDHVLVVEAGGSTGQAEAVIRRIKETAPGKPIRYLIATHFHFDHVSGIRPYVAEGATIIATPSTKRAIERVVAAEHRLRPDALSRAPQAPRFELMTSRKRVLGEGRRAVEIHDISPSPHADEMLIVYVPAARAVFEGDLLDLSVPGHVGTGGEDTAHFADQLRALGLAVDRIVPVHGQVASMEDLRQALARRGNK